MAIYEDFVADFSGNNAKAKFFKSVSRMGMLWPMIHIQLTNTFLPTRDSLILFSKWLVNSVLAQGLLTGVDPPYGEIVAFHGEFKFDRVSGTNQ